MKLELVKEILDAFINLMNPLVEVVIHDIKLDRICYINGCLSNRQIGDKSFLNFRKSDEKISGVNYPKMNFDGRLIKSISIQIAHNLLVCINCDISVFSTLNQLSQKLLNSSGKMPARLFSKDYQEKINISIHNFMKEKSWHYEFLTQLQKKKIIEHLFRSGAFDEKRAPESIGKALSISRATIYKYLKEWRK